MRISQRVRIALILLAILLLVSFLVALFAGPIFGTQFQNCPNPLVPCQSNLTISPGFFNRGMPLILLMATSVAILVFALTTETPDEALSRVP